MLRRELDGQLAGLPTILKNMKGKKMVDYRDNFIKCVDAPRFTYAPPSPHAHLTLCFPRSPKCLVACLPNTSTYIPSCAAALTRVSGTRPW